MKFYFKKRALFLLISQLSKLYNYFNKTPNYEKVF